MNWNRCSRSGRALKLFLKATAECILLGHKPQHMNGHGEHQSGVG
jgi:hypothetical protein